MMAQPPENHTSIVDLLPSYSNKTLGQAEMRKVQNHLQECALCRRELGEWEVTREATRLVFATAPSPSPFLMDRVWERIDVIPSVEPALQRSVMGKLTSLSLILLGQIRLIHRSIWIGSALVCLFGCVITIMATPQTPQQLLSFEELLTLFVTVAAATGSAFIYGSQVDPAFELTIATPTSVRLVMVSRMLLVVGYNFSLAALASFLFALWHGAGLWSIMQLWVGPMLLLSSLSLAISLLFGSTFAVMGTILVETLQALPGHLEERLFGLHIVGPNLWQTTPPIVLLALLIIACTLLYVPRQPRLAG